VVKVAFLKLNTDFYYIFIPVRQYWTMDVLDLHFYETHEFLPDLRWLRRGMDERRSREWKIIGQNSLLPDRWIN